MPEKKKAKPEFKKIEGQPGLFAFKNLKRSPEIAELVIKEAQKVSTAASRSTREQKSSKKSD